MFMGKGRQLGFAFVAEFFFVKNNFLSQNQKFSKFAYVLPHMTILYIYMYILYIYYIYNT